MKKFDYIRSKRRSSPGSFFRRLFRVGSIKKPFSSHFFSPLAKESESVEEIQQLSKEIKEREREMKRKLLV